MLCSKSKMEDYRAEKEEDETYKLHGEAEEDHSRHD